MMKKALAILLAGLMLLAAGCMKLTPPTPTEAPAPAPT